MNQASVVFTMLFEKRSKICPLPKNDELFTSRKMSSGSGVGRCEVYSTNPEHTEGATKGRGRHPEASHSMPVIPIAAG